MSDQYHESFQHLSRRALIASVAAASALPALGMTQRSAHAEGREATAPGRAPGIQLYTLRGSMEKDPKATLTAVAAMGYRAVEFAGYAGTAPAQIKRWLNELSLSAPSAHVDRYQLREDPEPLLEAAAEVGHEYIVLAWLAEEDRRSLDDYRRWAEVLNRAGEAARSYGLRVAYHNHDFELLPLEESLPQKLLMDETDPHLVDFELDFYWVRKAGLRIREVLGWSPERFTMAHIKDMNTNGEMVDVGSGIIDFQSLLASDEAAAIAHTFVEHDNSDDPFRTAALGRWHLSRYLGET